MRRGAESLITTAIIDVVVIVINQDDVRTGVLTYSSAKTGSRLEPFEINRRVVLAAREIGCGHASIEVLDSTLTLVSSRLSQ